MWYFLSQYVKLNTAILVANLVLFLVGVVFILGAIFLGGFTAAWTFLFPLPAKPLGVWSPGAAAAYLVGVLLVGVGFLLFYLDTAWAILLKHGSLGRALGWPQRFRGDDGKAPPPTVVASMLANAISVIAVVGWLYRESPVRLCSYYLTDQQVLLGNGLLALALLASIGWTVRAFTGPLRWTAPAPDGSDRRSG